jgi:hypothetical protein
VQANASALATPARTREGDIDDPPGDRQQVPESAGAAMAEDCPVTAGKNRGEPDAFVAQAAVADCVHATMDAVQVTRLDATGDGALADGRHKLGK